MIDSEKAILDVIKHWPSLEELVTHALSRHGFSDSNGGYGITYWSQDLITGI